LGVEVRVLDVTPEGWGRGLIASYLVVGGESSALVDVGPASSYGILEGRLRELGIAPEYVVVTHIHLDHAGAAGLAAERLGAKVLVHPRGARHLVDPSKLWAAAQEVLGEVARVYGEPPPAPRDAVVPVEDGYYLDLGGGGLRILHTPGHASHHMSVHVEGEGTLFTGDSAGVHVEVDGRIVELPTTPPPLRLDLYLASLDKMAGAGARRCAPTHYGIIEEPCTSYLARQKRQILDWYRAIEELAARGITSVDEAAKALAEKFEDARIAYEHPNPIISRVFYYGTVWGLLDAALRALARGSNA